MCHVTPPSTTPPDMLVVISAVVLVDSVDTPTVMRQMRELVGLSNSYISAKDSNSDVILLGNIAKYLMYLFKVCCLVECHVTTM